MNLVDAILAGVLFIIVSMLRILRAIVVWVLVICIGAVALVIIGLLWVYHLILPNKIIPK